MPSQLDALQQQLADVTERVKQSFGVLSAEELRERPAPDRWSVAECVAHLTMTTEAMLPGVEVVMARAPASTGRPLRPSLLGGMLARWLEPPIRRRVKTSAAFVPSPGNTDGDVLAEFAQSQEKLKALLQRYGDRDLNRGKVQSPFSRMVRYNPYAAFLILLAHQGRHVWQGETGRDEAVPAGRAPLERPAASGQPPHAMTLPISWSRLLVTWLAMAMAMSANGVFRELVLTPAMGATVAGIVSAALGILIIGFITWVGFRGMARSATTRSLLAMSVVLVVMTVAFEFAVGRLVDQKSWSELLVHYALWRGELWPVVLGFLALTPFLWGIRREA